MSGRFDVLGEALLRRGIAPRHVRRYMRELEEHFTDLVSEGAEAGLPPHAAENAAEQRIGRTEDLIDAMAERKELRSWVGQMPRTFLAGGPLLAFILIYAVQFFGMALIIEYFGGVPSQWGGRMPPAWLHPIWAWGFPFDNYLLPILLGWAFAAASLRQRMSWGWTIGGLAILALIGGTIMARYQWPADVMDPTAHWFFSFGFVTPEGWGTALFRCVYGFLLMAGPFWTLFRSTDRSAPSDLHPPARY